MSIGGTSLILSTLLLLSSSHAVTQQTGSKEQSSRPLKVAFVVSEGFTLIDFGGPWDVFHAARRGDQQSSPLFQTYAVSATTAPVSMGLTQTKLVPDYTFENAPKPDIIVVGAQDWRKEVPGLQTWLRRENSQDITILSVCIGASQLAEAGLLDGKQATTHHAFLNDFRQGYPKTKWLEGKRFVKVSDTIWTAGGLTSGIDLALHIVAVRFGEPIAEATARYLEYTGTGWKQGE